jgi:rhodanese-related sulfurtransferase/DNA-binding transcriptional ArsR family regulator
MTTMRSTKGIRSTDYARSLTTIAADRDPPLTTPVGISNLVFTRILEPMAPSTHRTFKNALYAQFARIGHAVSTPKRIEFLDLLGQSERTVADLADLTATPVKNTSAHLKALRATGLVETRKDAQRVFYRLADDGVHEFLRVLQGLAHTRLAEVERVTQQYLDGRDELEPISARELERRIEEGDVTVIDVRPREEYEAGHITGALSLPVDELKRGRSAPPKSREVVAYCRGRYCVYSVEAVTLLRKRGYRARRLADGLPDWRDEGRKVAVGHDSSRVAGVRRKSRPAARALR